MALIQVDFYSKALSKVTNFNVVMPNDILPEMVGDNEHYKRQMKTVYLLHGYSGSSKDWLLGSSVQEMAAKYNLAVVMPSGENSFYLDAKGTGKAYCKYVGQELVEYVRKTFGFSDKRQDTFIGGLSMGGFGAIHTGLTYPDTFGKIAALSSALIIHDIENKTEDFMNEMADYYYYTSVFGELDKLGKSENNPEYLIEKRIEKGEEIPPIYMACGTEDFLIEQNRRFYKFLQEKKVDAKYTESEGIHDWAFWNRYLEPSILWMLK